MDQFQQALKWITIFSACFLGAAEWSSPDGPDTPSDCLDVAIVGGGIGGTYTAYQLRNFGLKLTLFELSDRIGGRMFTANLPTVTGTTVELGAMRLRPEVDTHLVEVLKDVCLNIVDFPLNYGNANETVYYLRGRYLKTEELGGRRTPYNLRPDEKLSPERLVWKLFTENTNMSQIRYPPEEEIYSIHTTDGIPLYTLTLDNFYSRYASREAYNYLRDALLWDEATGRMGAHVALTFLTFPGDEAKNNDYKTIEGGFDRLPKRLLSRFLDTSGRHAVELNQQLLAIDGEIGNYRLRFSSTKQTHGYITQTLKVVCAKKVVLAIQRDCVEKIDFAPFQDPYFRKQLNSVIDVQAEKIFLAYPDAWWKNGNENITHARSNLPTKFTYDWRTGENGLVIHLPSYSDGENNVALWRELQGQGSSISGSLQGDQRVTTAVRNMIHSYMSRIYKLPKSSIPSPIGGGMQLWDTFPFKAAWHYYKPGFKMAETRDYMLKPFLNHNVVIVGNSWWPNDVQGWSESTLRMVQLLLDLYREPQP